MDKNGRVPGRRVLRLRDENPEAKLKDRLRHCTGWGSSPDEPLQFFRGANTSGSRSSYRKSTHPGTSHPKNGHRRH